MAETTLQLGFVPKNRGEYQSTPVTRYYKDNVVQYNGSSYIADPVGWSESNPTTTYVTIPPTDENGNLNTGWKVFASGNNTFTTGEKVDNVGIDSEPTAGSNNLVKSGGVKAAIPKIVNNLTEGGNTKTLSAEQGKLLANELGVKYDSVNLLNPDSIVQGKFLRISDGTEVTGYYGYTPMFEIPDEGLVLNCGLGSVGNLGTCSALFYDSNKSFLIGMSGTKNQSITINKTAQRKYVIFNLGDPNVAIEGYGVFAGHSVPSPFIPYNPIFSIDIPQEKVSGLVEVIQNIPTKVGGYNLYNRNDIDAKEGYYLSGNTLTSSATFAVTGFIPVKPGRCYQASYDGSIMDGITLARFVCQYDADKNYISGADLQPSNHNNNFITGSSTYYVRVSFNISYISKYQIELGSVATSYKEYSTKIQASDLHCDNILNIERKEFPFKGMSQTATLSNGQNITLPRNYVRKQVSFCCSIKKSSADTLNVVTGFGYNQSYGMWFTLTDTDITIIKRNISPTTQSHGLTLGEIIYIKYDVKDENLGVLSVTSNGNVFTIDIEHNYYGGGAAFVLNNGSNSIESSISVCFKDIVKEVFIFGDSYLGWTNSARWPYWILQWGYKSILIDNQPGGNSAQLLRSIETDLNLSVPTYCVWCLGMNDGGDTDINTPNSSWLEGVIKFISSCERFGVTPILATIPNVPTISHIGKNKWVKDSGYRYIDFAKSVGAESEGSTWFDGLLEPGSSRIHPTEKGAIQLANQVLINFPEISVND